MAEITYLEAIREALFEEMERDTNVFCLGEDIGAYGGAFKVTEGLMAKYGEQRVIDTPISEAGSSAPRRARRTWECGRCARCSSSTFISSGYDMLTNYVATARYRAMLPCPMVVRGPSGGYVRGGPFHSQNPEAAFLHTPGLKIVYPATAEDAKGLLKAAIRDDDPVLFFEHKYLYRRIKGRCPPAITSCRSGKARVAREGTDLSIITYAATVWKALEAAEELEQEDGLSVEVIDLRTLLPMDDDAIVATVKKTNRVLIVHEDTRTGGIAGEITARINELAFEWLDAPVLRRDGARRTASVRTAARGLRAAADGGHRLGGAPPGRLLSVAGAELRPSRIWWRFHSPYFRAEYRVVAVARKWGGFAPAEEFRRVTRQAALQVSSLVGFADPSGIDAARLYLAKRAANRQNSEGNPWPGWT